MTTSTAAKKVPVKKVSAIKNSAVKELAKVEVSSAISATPAVKLKRVRDTFSMPSTDYALIAALKQRAENAGSGMKKSELLRAGLRALQQMNEKAFSTACKAVKGS